MGCEPFALQGCAPGFPADRKKGRSAPPTPPPWPEPCRAAPLASAASVASPSMSALLATETLASSSESARTRIKVRLGVLRHLRSITAVICSGCLALAMSLRKPSQRSASEYLRNIAVRPRCANRSGAELQLIESYNPLESGLEPPICISGTEASRRGGLQDGYLLFSTKPRMRSVAPARRK